MSLSSQLALEDVGAFLLGPSFLTADPMGPLLDQDEEEALSPSSSLSSEGRAPPSPPLSFSSSYASSPYSSSTPSPSPPPPVHPSFLEKGDVADMLSFPWLGEGDLLDGHIGADVKEDAFSGMDWMTEKIDLSDFDLDSLISSCASDGPPSSPVDLLASLETHMDLDPFTATLPAQPEVLDLGLPLADLPPLPLDLPLPEDEEEEEEGRMEELVPEDVEVKSEPPSPALPQTPAFTLELGSEVDVLEVDKVASGLVPEPSGSLQASCTPILVSLSPSATFVVVLTPKEEPTLLHASTSSISTTSSSISSDSESDSGIDSSVSGSPPHRSSSPSSSSPSSSSSGACRTKPYSKPSPSPSASSVSPKVKSAGGSAPPKVVEKKLKKMEQNKTAATRYRQKKRVEQDVLNVECSELETRNRQLAEKADSISREIQYLKDLMEEVRSAKNRRVPAKSAAD